MKKQYAVVEIVTDDPFGEQAAPATTPLFSIDGVEYSIPEEIPASIALGALDVARRQGEEIMMSWALEEVLGPEGYRALITCRSVTTAQLKTIMETVVERVLGSLEDESGN